MFAREAYRTIEADIGDVDSDWLHRTAKTISRVNNFSYGDQWNIVYDYSRCKLTNESDKLIALCGIAQALSSAVSGAYYAGIWSP
jgi:hypothetical protein